MEFYSSSEISIQLICAVDKWGVKYELSHIPTYIDKDVNVFACDVENMPLKIYGARCERKVVYKINGADKKYIRPRIKILTDQKQCKKEDDKEHLPFFFVVD